MLTTLNARLLIASWKKPRVPVAIRHAGNESQLRTLFSLPEAFISEIAFCRILHEVLETNEEIDLIAVPRVNIVNGLTQEDVTQWGWQLNNQGWVNWPDNQHRIFRNKPEIKWVNKVHEKIVGWKTYAELPSEDDSYALYHIKDIDRQRAQNEFYSTI